MDLKPAQARSYEPRAVNTATTIRMMRVMQQFYQMTGDRSFLQGLEKASQFVCSQALPDSMARLWRSPYLNEGEILVPRFVDPDSGKPLFIHRKGGNVKNGIYYVDYSIRIDTKTAAIAVGKQCNQISILKWHDFSLIYC